ncbi:dienelactone hydrolase family-domain-containing protein [Scenedesmus sp. NREL 46B-D3]|nr:dienelactone hydrolase family-domain-containing protein [Scenedesmus sp. NREL 46B-D3]
MQRIIAVLLLGATLVAQAKPLPVKLIQYFAKSHSSNGNAVGVVQWTGKGTGKEVKLAGLDAYVATPAGPYKAAVLMIPDIYGWQTDGTRVWADNMAKQGFLVVVPDYFKGNPRKKTDSGDTFAAWLALFPRETVMKESTDVIAAIRKTYPSVQKVGVAGFCWGGLYAVLLAGGKTPAVSASAVYHGSLITRADVEAINAPITFQQSDPEVDNQINTEFYKEIKAILAAKAKQGLDASITYYIGMPHGYAVRGAEAGNSASATGALKAGAAFFRKHFN